VTNEDNTRIANKDKKPNSARSTVDANKRTTISREDLIEI
jgi:hypothetical protein